MNALDGHLHLRAVRASDGSTALSDQSFRAPFHLSKPNWDPEAEVPLIDINAEGQYYGMRTFQQDLVRLVMAGRVEKDAAEAIVAQPADFNVALKRAGYIRSGVAKLEGVGR